jgi:endonuclease/exonuclease/phosphatase family metal-dependent hydrolase
LLCEQLEERAVPAGTIRVVSYNMEADINGVTTPRSGFYQVLEGIGEERLQGDVQPLDILVLQETTSNSTTVAPIVSNLNSYYNGSAVYAQSSYQATQSGSNDDGNGPNALVYNTTTLNLLASVGVGTPQGSGNGEYRQVVRYEFQPVGDSGTTGIFYVYVSHMKSGTTSQDATDRGEEATLIRNDEATLPATASVLYTGDLNSAPPEAEFTNFTASGQGEAYDPVNFSTSVQYYSESATDLRYRDDYELMTSNVLNDTGAINYVSGTLHGFGNNGTTPSGGSVDSGSDTALNSDLVQDGGTFISASTLYSDLTTASDHLPAVADYTDVVNVAPTITSAAGTTFTVGSGGSFQATATGTPSTITFSETGTLPAGVTFTSAGLLSGTPTVAGTFPLVITASNGVNPNATQNFTLTAVAATITTLTDNGISAATAGGSIETGYPIGFTVTVAGATTPTGTVQLEDTANGNALVGTAQTLAGGTVTFTVTATAANNLGVGTHQLFAVYIPTGYFAASQSNPVGQVIDAVFKVQTLGTTATSNFSPTATGFQVTFNAVVAPSDLFAWGTAATTSIRLQTGSTLVAGSVVFDAATTQATFVATGKPNSTGGNPATGILLPGATYTPTLSGTNANPFEDTLGHVLGSSTATGGADYNTPFTSPTNATATTVSVPYFTRGYSQAVNILIPGNTAGIPLVISVPAGGTALTSASFDVFYNPALLAVSGGSITAAGFTGTVTVPSAGQAHITLSGGTLAAGTTTVVASLTASVPATAPFKDKEVLDLRNIDLNGGTNNGQDGSAVHVVAFVADTDFSRSYSSQDAFNLLQVAIGAAQGFAAYQLADPVVIGNTDNNGELSAQDAFNTLQVAIGNTVAGIPALPTGSAPPSGGPDPRLYFVNVTGAVGSTVTVALDMEVTAANGLLYNSDDLAVLFDPTKFTVANVRSGNYPGMGTANLSTVSKVDNTGGTIRIGQFFSGGTAPTLPNGSNGDLVLMDVTILTGVQPGTTPLNLAANADGGFSDVNGGAATVNPAPTNAGNDPNVDGVLTITGNAKPPPRNFVPATSVALPTVPFNPAGVPGPLTATPNTEMLSGNGTIGGNSHDEFWRLFGSSQGSPVDNTDLGNNNGFPGASHPDANPSGWFFDDNAEGYGWLVDPINEPTKS